MNSFDAGPDTYVEVTRKGWGSRMGGSFFGVLIGILCFLGSFWVLYWNEGRPDMSRVAANAVEIDAGTLDTQHVGQLVAITGPFTARGKLGDEFIRPGSYVSLRRTVEMYAWDEDVRTETHKEIGGGETEVKVYNYTTRWTSSPENSSSFKKPYGHHNPQKQVPDRTVNASGATVGRYIPDVAQLTMPAYRELAVTGQMLREGGVQGRYVYLERGALSRPQVGDVRLSYAAVPSGERVTLLGTLQPGNHVAAYQDPNGHAIYRAIYGSKQDAVATMASEHKLTTWLLRLLGFGMMWLGLFLIAEPINVVLDILPFLGSLGRGLSGFGTFLVALMLSLVTILVSIILHNLLLVLLVGLGALVAGFMLFGRKREQAARS